MTSLGSVARPLGSLAAALGRWPESRALFAEALEHAQTLRSPVLRALGELDQARALRAHPRAGERREAEWLLESVEKASLSLELSALLARARALR